MSVQLHGYTHENINALLVWKVFSAVLAVHLKYIVMRFIANTQKGYRNLNGLQYPFNYI